MANKNLHDKLRKISSAGHSGAPLAPGSRFNQISYEDNVIKTLRPVSVLERVANLTFTDNVDCGSLRARQHEVEGSVQPIEIDGQMKVQDFPFPCEEVMDIEFGMGCFRKLSKEQKRKLECNNQRYLQSVMEADILEARLVLEKTVLGLMTADVDRYNQGVAAGVSTQCYNMGSCSSPITLTPDSIEEIFQRARAIFNEYNIPTGLGGLGAPFAIGHPFIEMAMLSNDKLSSYYHQGSCVSCPRIDGMIKTPIYGFEVMLTSCLPTCQFNDETVYPILFGFKGATDVIVEFEQIEHDNPHPGDRSHYYGKYWDFGIKVWDPRQLAIAWVRIEK